MSHKRNESIELGFYPFNQVLFHAPSVFFLNLTQCVVIFFRQMQINRQRQSVIFSSQHKAYSQILETLSKQNEKSIKKMVNEESKNWNKSSGMSARISFDIAML